MVRRAENLSTSCADCLEIWEHQLPGDLRACPGLYRDCFNFDVSSSDMKRNNVVFRKYAG